jgi:hypothetical protein
VGRREGGVGCANDGAVLGDGGHFGGVLFGGSADGLFGFCLSWRDYVMGWRGEKMMVMGFASALREEGCLVLISPRELPV